MADFKGMKISLVSHCLGLIIENMDFAKRSIIKNQIVDLDKIIGTIQEPLENIMK